MNPHSVAGRGRIYAEYGRGDPEVIWREDMDVSWMNRHEAREAIPPAFTAFIGAELLRQLRPSQASQARGETKKEPVEQSVSS